MSGQLHFTEDDVLRIRTSWCDIQTNNRYHKDSFISRLYSNLNAANPELKKTINGETLSEDSMLFGDLLTYSVNYLHDSQRFDKFVQLFCEENVRFVANTVKYLEPMGSALMQTLKQWLGGKLQSDLENLWVKLYIFVANQLLTYSNDSDGESDVCSTFSRDSIRATDESEEEEIAPLNVRPKTPLEAAEETIPTPEPKREIVSENTQDYNEINELGQYEVDNGSNEFKGEIEQPKSAYKVVSFDLTKNDKYRGFRRSVHFSTPGEQISISTPEAPTFQRVHTEDDTVDFDQKRLSTINTGSTTSLNSFDPRKLKRASSIHSEQKLGGFVPQKFEDNDLPPTPKVEDAESELFEDAVDAYQFPDPVLTPRSSRRPQSTHGSPSNDDLQNCEAESTNSENKADLRKLRLNKPMRKIVDTPEDEFKKDNEKSFGFDPRKSISRRSTLSTSSFQSFEDNKSNEDATSAMSESISLSHKMKEERNNQINLDIDTKHDGTKGLTPIVETDYDDASSRYDSSDDDVSSSRSSNNERKRIVSDSDDVSSNDSSLSLHNSDYRSSISSGTEASSNHSPLIGNFRKEFPTHKTNVSDISSIGNFNAPGSATKSLASRSTSSLLLPKDPEQLKNRVSLGFMRSSFVLKKEMEQMGYNIPENIFTKPPTIPAAQQARGSRETLSSSSSSDNDCFDLINSFSIEAPVKTKVRKNRLTTSSTPNLNGNQRNVFGYTSIVMDPPQDAQPAKKEKSVKKRFSLSSLFSRKKSSLKTKNISAPMQNSTSAYQSQADLASICTVESNHSSISGFSFFSRRKSSIDTRYSVYGAHSRKDSKYQIKSVPYKVFA